MTREEKLILLIEEASEVIQAATKILRFGWDNKHPLHPQDRMDNESELIQEVADFNVICNLLEFDDTSMQEAVSYKKERLVNLGIFDHSEVYK